MCVCRHVCVFVCVCVPTRVYTRRGTAFLSREVLGLVIFGTVHPPDDGRGWCQQTSPWETVTKTETTGDPWTSGTGHDSPPPSP